MEVRIKNLSYLIEKKRTVTSYIIDAVTWKSSNEITKEGSLMLDQICLNLLPGTVTTLMGLGNEYKHLIECVAVRQTGGYLGGRIVYDGVIRKNGIFKDIVLINDAGLLHFESLSVFDYFLFGARLRISQGIIECRERARLAARVAGLDGTLLLSSLTKSEIRILNIATELVGNPSMMCLIDPAEGLDASGKLDVLKVLHTISKRVSSMTTILYSINCIDDESMRHMDNIGIFINNKLEYFESSKIFRNIESRHTFEELIMHASKIILEAAREFTLLHKNSKELIKIHKNSLQNIIQNLKKYSAVQEKTLPSSVAVEKNKPEGVTIKNAPVARLSSVRQKPSNDAPPVIDAGWNVYSNDMTPTTLHGYQQFDDQNANNPITSESSAQDEHEAKEYDQESQKYDIPPTNHESFYSASRRGGVDGLNTRAPKSLWEEVTILIKRSIQYHMNNRAYIMMGLIQFSAAGFIVGCFAISRGNNFLQLVNIIDPTTQLIDSSAYDTTSAMFIVVAISLTGTAFTVPTLHKNMLLLKYEVASGLQSTVSSWMSLWLIDIPLFILASLFIATIVFSMIRLQGANAELYGAVILITLSGYSLSACCAAWSSSPVAATLAFSMIASYSIIFTGYFQTIPDLPGIWPWASNVAYTRWGFEALVIAANSNSIDRGSYLDLYNFDDTSSGYCITWLLLWFAILQFMVIIGISPPFLKVKFLTDRRFEQQKVKVSEPTTSSSSSTSPQYLNPSPVAVATISPIQYVDSIHSTETKDESSIVPSNNNLPPAPTNDPIDFELASNTVFSYDELYLPTVTIPNASSITVHFKQIKYVQESDFSLESNEPLLQRVFGIIQPGSCCCILDGSKAGTNHLLLKILSGRNRFVGTTTGVISVNDQKLSKDLFYINAAFVQKGDITNISTLTVREVLRYSALLKRTDQKSFRSCETVFRRCCKSKSFDAYEEVGGIEIIGKTGDVEDRINSVISMLGLESLADEVIGGLDNTASSVVDVNESFSLLSRSRIRSFITGDSHWQNPNNNKTEHNENHPVQKNGSIHGIISSMSALLGIDTITPRKLTPAQLRCLTLGVELVNKPSLIFFEDPTFGLEWADAKVVMKVLQSLAAGGRTIICSVDNPSNRVFLGSNQTFILGSGHLLYSGSTESAESYFENIGFERKSAENSIEYIMEIAADRGKMSFSTGYGIRQRGNVLSPEDIADLNRSLSNMRESNEAAIASSSNTVTSELEDDSEISMSTLSIDSNGLTSPRKIRFQTISMSEEVAQPDEGVSASYGYDDEDHPSSPGITQEQVPTEVKVSLEISTSNPSGLSKDIASIYLRGGGKASNGYSKQNHQLRNANRLTKKSNKTKGFGQSSLSSRQKQPNEPHHNPSMGSKSKRNTIITVSSRQVLSHYRHVPSMGPTAWVLLERGMKILYGHRRTVVMYLVKCLAVGLFLGSVYWGLNDGSVNERLGLFSMTYLFINLFVIDSLDGIYERKESFLRESSVDSSNYISYAIADAIPMQWLHICGSAIVVIPIYLMSGLRDNFVAFLYFFCMLWASTYCNYSLAYFMSMCFESLSRAKVVYTGVVIPLQLITSGYVILISTMSPWNSWGAFICPMSYYIAGLFRNEFDSNSVALGGSVSYATLSDYFSYKTSLTTSLVVLIIMGLFYKTMWLILLYLHTVAKQKEVLRRVRGFRRRARRIVTAGLRYRDSYSQAALNNNGGVTSSGIESNGDPHHDLHDSALADLDHNSMLYDMM